MIELYDGKRLLGTYATIQDAVDAASAGNTIVLGSGTFNETVIVDKAVNFEGQGPENTIIDGTGLSGSGLHLVGDLGDDNTIKISGISFENHSVAGIDFDDDATLEKLEIKDANFENNAINGVRIGGDYDPVALDKVTIKDSTFANNGDGSNNGDGDILFFQYYGDARIEDVEITGGGTADNAIQFRGDDGEIGNVMIKDVDIDGAYAKTGIAIYNYSEGKGLKFRDVDVSAVTGWGLPLNTDGVGGKVDVKGLDTSEAPGVAAVQGDGSDNRLRADKDSPSFLNGKDGDDDLRGGDADDILQGGGGDDGIDGGKGVDMALYSGALADYDIDPGNGRGGGGKTTITDLRDGSPDGTDKLKDVELLRFTNGTSDVSDDVIYDMRLETTTQTDASIAAAGQTGGNLLVGSGIPASDFVVTHNEDLGIELALNVRYRQGPAVDPVSVDADGTVRFAVNDGPQSTDNGSSSDNADRAAWSFQYSIVTGLDGETTDLSDFTFKLFIDTDVTEGTDFRELTMIDPGVPLGNDTGFVWFDQDGNPTIGDDGGNANVAQNSENYAFGFIENYIDADPNTPGQQDYSDGGFGEAQFDIRLEAYDNHGDLVAYTHIAVDVFDMV